MTHRVVIWLCSKHGSERFLAQDRGKRFAAKVHAAWAAGGSITPWRLAALRAHIRRFHGIGGNRDQPGSYAWPELRREAERRFAAGDDPRTVIDELRSRYCAGPAVVPSPRTMRRWFTQARWRDGGQPLRVRPREPVPRWKRVPWEYILLPDAIIENIFYVDVPPAYPDP
jgi:hypothetical protein